MPPKIRELLAELERNAFYDRGGKGSHRNFKHASGVRVTISGKPGDDADKYQIQQVKQAIKKVTKK